MCIEDREQKGFKTFHPLTNGKNSTKRRQNADGKGIFAQIQALKYLTVTLKMEAAHY
jgi:hypothetical protein